MSKVNCRAKTTDEVSNRERKNRTLAYEAACESITVLENDGVLPLKPCTVALFGSAAAMTVKGGTGSGEVNERHSVGIREGLVKAGFQVKTNMWLRDWRREFRKGKKEYEAHHKQGIPIGQSAEELINIMANPYRMPAGRTITEADIEESEAEVCIYAIARQAGECDDRSLDAFDFTLMPQEIENLKIAAYYYQKVILVINVGGSMDLSGLDEVPGINAVVYFCQQGMEGGNALASVLTGKVNPSGGLTDTWVMSYEDVPFGEGFGDMDGNPKETDYREGIYVGYRYYDTAGIPVRYPFGYGQSYTTFALDAVQVSVYPGGGTAVIAVTNTGAVAGKRFVQLYAACPAVSQPKEKKKLIGYAKTKLLAPGQRQEVTISFDLHALTSYVEAQAAYVLDAGEYLLLYGVNAADVRPAAVIRLAETVVYEKCRHICVPDKEIEEFVPGSMGKAAGCTDGTMDFGDGTAAGAEEAADSGTEEAASCTGKAADSGKDEAAGGTDEAVDFGAGKAADSGKDEVSAGAEEAVCRDAGPKKAAAVPVLELSASSIKTRRYRYPKHQPVWDTQTETWMAKLGVQEKLQLLAGSGVMSMIGSGSPTLTVPGAAAYTNRIDAAGIPSVALCDGPAGLRLQRVSALTKKGQIKPVEMMMDFMNDWPPYLKKLMCGDPKKDTLLYQNATAFPVGTALAMTWNQELLEEVGDAVGTEMEEFGCTFWLAPGMNIHRNPLCGRNYEYYSEDPVVSGKCAAAIARGVQKHPGCYVTIKHYAANNQEKGRAGMSSNVNERPLREIYLEGFRIAVKEGGAKAVMTSYNKVNHVFAANSYDLCTRALRDEWGFEGVVMTDWMSTDKGLAGRSRAYRAGNDLIMPGGSSVWKECYKDYQNGRLTEEVIDLCCSRVLKAVADSGIR